MTNISIIILVGREERHIRRCLERLAPLSPRQVFIVESQKGDRTHEIAVETAKSLNWRIEECLNVGIGAGKCLNGRIGAGKCLNGRIEECLNVGGGVGERCSADESDSPIQTSKHSNIQTLLTMVWHDWPGLYAKQFNWSLDNLPIEGEWVLRLDADEYLTSDTIEKLKSFLSSTSTTNFNSSNIVGLTFELKRRFCGGEIRHATNGIRLLRLWRMGRGKSEERAMDEHIAIDGISDLDELRRLGKVVDFDGAFYDDNLNDMDWWREKHRGYAKREAADALAFGRGELRFKPMKEKYYRLPRYIRAIVYFCIRYFLKGGFLDGYAGWMWNFWQGLWYRWIVDREIGREGRGGL